MRTRLTSGLKRCKAFECIHRKHLKDLTQWRYNRKSGTNSRIMRFTHSMHGLFANRYNASDSTCGQHNTIADNISSYFQFYTSFRK